MSRETAAQAADGRVTPTAAVPRVALTREEAAASLGMSLDSFERHVQPSIRMVRKGRHLFPGNEAEAATMLDAYFAWQAGGETMAQTMAHPEETAA